MSIKLSIAILILVFFLLVLLLSLLKKGRIPVKYSIVWFFAILILILVAIVPNFLVYIKDIFGIITVSNLVVGILLSILIVINIVFTVIISGQNSKIILLIQEVSLLKKKVERMENSEKNE